MAGSSSGRSGAEIVDPGLMRQKAFHDEILRQGSMPITLLRLALNGRTLTRDMSIDLQVDGDVPVSTEGAREP